MLYYAVVAWGMDFTGYIVDYGTFPDQKRRYFTLRQASKTLQAAFPGTGQEGAWRAGYSPEEICEALERKQTINENREWPTWQDVPEGQPLEHVKAGKEG